MKKHKTMRSLLAWLLCVLLLTAALPASALAAERDTSASGYLLENIADENGDIVTELGVFDTATVEFIYVGLYNAFQSAWSTLTEQGVETAAALAEAAAAYDGGEKTAPGDYTNEAKIAAVSAVVMGQEEAPAGDTPLSKLEALSVLYAVRDCVAAATYADASLAEAVGSDYADMTQFFGHVYTGEGELEAGMTESSDDTWLVMADYDFVNTPIGTASNAYTYLGDPVSYIDTEYDLTSPDTAVDGAEAAMGTLTDRGVIYNATLRNAYYREGIGSGIAIVGADTDVTMTSTDGSLVISGSGGSMAGTAYVAFGASLLVQNAVAYSSSQHLTNNLYNGTIHYLNSYAVGAGRVFSSDFWGGYQVFENSIATGGNVTDEPTTLIVKNSVYGNSVGGNGFASQYFENSILNVGAASFQNTTSLITDTGSLTLVNSVMNSSGSTLVSVTKGENLILTLVDSAVNLSGNGLASLDESTSINHSDSLNQGDDVYDALFDSEIAVYLYGDNTIVTTDGTLTASIADGASLYIYGSIVDENGDEIVIDGAQVIATEGYGTLTVVASDEEAAEEAAASDEAADDTASEEAADDSSSGESSASGETSGETGSSAGLSGMLALSNYVFVNAGGEATAAYYGVYEEDETCQYAPTGSADAVAVYLDSALTQEAQDVTVSIERDEIVISGLATEGNVAYYLSTGEDGYTTIIYAVNDEYDQNAATLTLADGTEMQLTTYAPNMAYGDYTAVAGENEINGESAVYIGANRTARSVEDMTDLADASEEKLAVAAWWLTAGATNSGASLTEFGSDLYNFEYVVAIYRLFQIVNEQMTFAYGFVDATDYVAGMGSNDQFSDAVSATMGSGIWNGIYTQLSDTKLP
ncbi:MAG: hypothetical protein LJU34_08665 [Oscillospiraceae bacterium]|nr:hypothetical protein [Oscillospiraceae bacterium]